MKKVLRKHVDELKNFFKQVKDNEHIREGASVVSSTKITLPDGDEVDAMIIASDKDDADKDFDKVWSYHFLTAIEKLSAARIKVLTHIITNRNQDNLFIFDLQNISLETGVSTASINRVFQLLLEPPNNLLTRVKRGIYRIDPNIIFRGKSSRRLAIVRLYEKERKTNNVHKLPFNNKQEFYKEIEADNEVEMSKKTSKKNQLTIEDDTRIKK